MNFGLQIKLQLVSYMKNQELGRLLKLSDKFFGHNLRQTIFKILLKFKEIFRNCVC